MSLWWPQESGDQRTSIGYTTQKSLDQHKSLGYTCLCGDLRKVWISTSLWVIRVFVVTSEKSESAQVSRLYVSLWWPQKSRNQHKSLGYTCLCGDLRKVGISTSLWVIRVFVVTSEKSESAQVSGLYVSLWWPQKSRNQHKSLGYTCLCGDLRKVWISTSP